jgi:hypothetical protein
MKSNGIFAMILKQRTYRERFMAFPIREALLCHCAKDCWNGMEDTIASLDTKGTWNVVDISAVPAGRKVILVPRTWTHLIKR